MSTPFERLLAEYTGYESSQTGADQRSLRCFRAERALLDDPTSLDTATDRLSVWVRTLRQVEDFTRTHNRLPRLNNRIPHSARLPDEGRLADWLRFQRKPATRDQHCDYQRRRLETLDGFSWDPLGDAWNNRLKRLIEFMTVHGRMPLYRSALEEERRLAGWLAKQRHLLRNGRLPEQRATALRRALSRQSL